MCGGGALLNTQVRGGGGAEARCSTHRFVGGGGGAEAHCSTHMQWVGGGQRHSLHTSLPWPSAPTLSLSTWPSTPTLATHRHRHHYRLHHVRRATSASTSCPNTSPPPPPPPEPRAQGDFCINCGAPFIRSFTTFEQLPLVEFELDPSISDEEAQRILGEDSGLEPLRRSGGASAGGGANVLRLDEHDNIHKIDDAFTAQMMVPNQPIRVDRGTLRRLKSTEVGGWARGGAGERAGLTLGLGFRAAGLRVCGPRFTCLSPLPPPPLFQVIAPI